MTPYYSQQMIARSYLPLCVEIEVVGPADALAVTATRSEKGRSIVVKAVNPESEDASAIIDIGGGHGTVRRVRVPCRSGFRDDPNMGCKVGRTLRAR